MNKKKLSIFVNSLAGGGAERVVSILLQHLNHDFEIHLILINDLIEYNIPAGQKIYVLDKSLSKNPAINILKIPLLAFRYFRYLKRNHISVSFSFLNRPNFISGFLKYFGWKGTILMSERAFTSLFYPKTTFEGKIGQFMVRWLYAKSHVIVSNSKLTALDLTTTFNIQSRSEVINNPIDIQHVNSFISKPDASANDVDKVFTFVSLGRLGPEKNHSILIKAVALIKEQPFRLQIIGKGVLREKLEEEIKLAGLSDKVFLLPFNSQPFTLLSKADCFLLSSNFEGFPNVLLEAMACGLPVISTDCKSGPRELLAPDLDIQDNLKDQLMLGEYGILVPVNDPVTMSKAMLEMMTKQALRTKYNEKGIARANEFDVPIIVEKFKNLINEFIG